MDFLADIWVTCPVCEGHRFNRETLQVRFKGKTIAQVLEMDVQEALTHFENIPDIRHKLQTLHDVGLDYMKLGQPSPTLSGGEAQRVKLARELVKKSTGRTLYLLDEPTTGLHFADIQLLLKVLHDFVDAGNTVLVVEHNLEVIKTADWIIDLGPEGGGAGGQIVAVGTPEEVARVDGSYTGRSLRPVLDGPAARGRPATAGPAAADAGRHQGPPRGPDRRHPRSRRPAAQSQKRRRGRSPRPAHGLLRAQRVGQKLAGHGHHLRRGPAALRGKPASYARQFVGQMQKPKLDHIEGLSPAIAIEQKHSGHTPRSTVGTVTEIYDYLRILVARLGQPYCPACNIPIGTQSADEVIGKIMDHAGGTKLFLSAPLEIQVGQRYETLWEEPRRPATPGCGSTAGPTRWTAAGHRPPPQARGGGGGRPHHVRPDARSRIAGSVEMALALGKGVVHAVYPQDDVPEPRWPIDRPQPAFRLRPLRAELRAAHAAPFLLQQLRWAGARPAKGWACRPAPIPRPCCAIRSSRWPKGRRPSGPTPAARCLPPCSRSFCRAHGHARRRAFRAARRPASPADHARHRRAMVRSVPSEPVRPAAKRSVVSRPTAAVQACLPLPIQRPLSGPGGGRPRLARPAQPVEHLVDEVECTVCGGSRLRDDAAAVRFAAARWTNCAASRWASCWPSSRPGS